MQKHFLRLALGVLFSLLFFVVVRQTHAQQIPQQNQFSEYHNINPDVPQNFNTYTQSVFINIASTIACQLTGIDPVNNNGKCLGVDPETQKIGFVEGGSGLIGITGGMIAFTFEIPVSSTQYGKYLADNFGVAKKTYAQAPPELDKEGGIGFIGLSPLLKLWSAFRNLVYIIFVIAFLIVGLGVMFRVKIDPRTVMTLQNQIPKIIVALLLVTFSYAIAGFLIDMMYVFMYLLYNIFSPLLQDTGNLNPAKLQGSNPLTAIGAWGGIKIVYQAAEGLGGIIGSLFDGSIGKILAQVVGTILGAGAGSIGGGFGIGTLIGAGIGLIGGSLLGSKLFGIIGGVIAFIVLGAAVLTALFRLWFQLLKAYIAILLNTVLAPFWIMGSMIPGSSFTFGAWMREMIGNLLAFPATLLMILFGKILIDSFGVGYTGDFAPPFIGNPGNHSQFGALLGIGVILLTPNVVNLVKQAVKAPKGELTTTIGQSLSVGAGIATTPASKIGGRFWGVNPYTNEPRYLTKEFINRFGRGTSIVSKALRGITGTGKWYTENTPEGRAEERRNRLRNVFRRRGRGGNGGNGRGTPPGSPTPPSGPGGPSSTPPASGGWSSLSEEQRRARLGDRYRPTQKTLDERAEASQNTPGGNNPGGTPNGGNGENQPGEENTNTPTNTQPPIPHGEGAEQESQSEQSERNEQDQQQQGGGGSTHQENTAELKTLEELTRSIERLRREQNEGQKDNRAEIASLEEKIKKLNTP